MRQYLRMADVARYLQLNPKTVHELYRAGRMPKPIRVQLVDVRGRQGPLWEPEQIREWAIATGRLLPRAGGDEIRRARPGRRSNAQ